MTMAVISPAWKVRMYGNLGMVEVCGVVDIYSDCNINLSNKIIPLFSDGICLVFMSVQIALPIIILLSAFATSIYAEFVSVITAGTPLHKEIVFPPNSSMWLIAIICLFQKMVEVALYRVMLVEQSGIRTGMLYEIWGDYFNDLVLILLALRYVRRFNSFFASYLFLVDWCIFILMFVATLLLAASAAHPSWTSVLIGGEVTTNDNHLVIPGFMTVVQDMLYTVGLNISDTDVGNDLKSILYEPDSFVVNRQIAVGLWDLSYCKSTYVDETSHWTSNQLFSGENNRASHKALIYMDIETHEEIVDHAYEKNDYFGESVYMAYRGCRFFVFCSYFLQICVFLEIIINTKTFDKLKYQNIVVLFIFNVLTIAMFHSIHVYRNTLSGSAFVLFCISSIVFNTTLVLGNFSMPRAYVAGYEYSLSDTK